MPARLEGVDQVLAALDAAGADVTDRKVNKAAADIVLAAAEPLSPVGATGKLKRSGKSSATNKVGVVTYGGPLVPWAASVIFGAPPPRVQGGFVRPNPFPYRAGDARIEDITDVYTRAATKALTDRLS